MACRIAVTLGAFGAHGLASILSDKMTDIYRTAVTYHFYHALAILAVAAGAGSLWSSRWCGRACWLWSIGILAFSGSLCPRPDRTRRARRHPIGVAMIAGWVSIALAATHPRD